MSQALTSSWLCKTVASDNTQLNVEVKRVYRVQIFNLQQQAEPSDRQFPVCCEISDKANFIMAAFSTKTAKQFKTEESQNVHSFEGTLIQITSFTLRLFDPFNTTDKLATMSPTAIRGSGKPQFWLLIKRFKFESYQANSIFGEPAFITSDPGVRKRLNSLVTHPQQQQQQQQRAAVAASDGKADNNACSEPNASKVPANDNRRPDLNEDQLRKKQRCSPTPQLSTAPGTQPTPQQITANISLPTLASVPFLSDMETAWKFDCMWQALAIQQNCVLSMPLHGQSLGQTCVNGNSPQAPRTEVSAVAATIAWESVAARAPRFIQHAPKPPVAKAAKAANPKKPMDDLNGLTSDPTEELTPADQLMEQLYGKVTSSLYEYAGDVEVGSEAPSQWSEGSANQALDAVSVYQSSTQWTQERAFIISEK